MVTTALCSSRMRAHGVSSRLTTLLSSLDLGSRLSSTTGSQPRQLSRAFRPSTPQPVLGSYANRPNRVVRVGPRPPPFVRVDRPPPSPSVAPHAFRRFSRTCPRPPVVPITPPPPPPVVLTRPAHRFLDARPCLPRVAPISPPPAAPLVAPRPFRLSYRPYPRPPVALITPPPPPPVVVSRPAHRFFPARPRPRPLPLPLTAPRPPLRVVHVGPRPACRPLPAAFFAEPVAPCPCCASPSSLSTFTLPDASPRPSLPVLTADPPLLIINIPHSPSPRTPRVYPRPSPVAYTPVSLPSSDSPYILPDVPDTQFIVPHLLGDLPAGILWRSPRLPALPSTRMPAPAPASTLTPIRQPADYTFLPSPVSPAPSSPDIWEDDGWVAPPETWAICPPSLGTPVTPSPVVTRRFTAASSSDSSSGMSWISSCPSSLNIHTIDCDMDSWCSCPGRASPVRTSAPPETPATPTTSFAYSSGGGRSLLGRIADTFTESLSWLSRGLSTGISSLFGAHG